VRVPELSSEVQGCSDGGRVGGYRRAEEPHQSPSTRRPSSPAGTRPRRRAGMWLMSVVAGHSRCFRSPSC
jgi:hypothetical protein